MQKFTYHTHNDNFGIFDGKNTAEEMISKAEELGFETIGVSNHLIWHPNIYTDREAMFFDDFNKALDVHKRNIEYIREVGSKHKIKVLVGAETDFFSSSQWRTNFEKMIKELDFDYLIGSNHFVKNKEESFICNLYHLKYLPEDFDKDFLEECIKEHWLNIVECIKSGYFDFMAHLDYCTVKIPDKEEYDEYRWQIIETLDKLKMPFEVNTSGYNRGQEQYPKRWMLKELCKRGVPTLLSDDAHRTDQIGQFFDKAEKLLEDCGCYKRFSLKN